MTALIFILTPEAVHIALDSLALQPVTGRPFLHVTKLFPLPHLGSVMCGTGAMFVVLDWFVFIERQILANGLRLLDELAPRVLPGIGKEHGLSESMTATIYHFGYLQDEQRFAGFAYRSNNGFKSERLEYGLGMKPPHEDLMNLGAQWVSDEGVAQGFDRMMEQMKARDDSLTPEKRVGIGGEIHQISLLSKTTYLVHVSHRFDDYHDAFKEMQETLRDINQKAQG